MNENFRQGFEKEASIAHGLGKLIGGTGRAVSRVGSIPSTAAVNFKRGLQGKPKVTTKQVHEAKKYKKAQKARAEANQRKAMEAERRAAEQAEREAAEAAAKKKETRKKIMGYAKPLAAGAAITGGSLYGMKKLDEYQQNKLNENTAPMGYGYYSTKQAGIGDWFAKMIFPKAVNALDDVARKVTKDELLGENVNRVAKQIADKGKMTHELSPEQMKMVMDKIEQVKPKIGPGTVLGAAILAGAGAPIGAAMVRKTTDVGEKVLKTDIPMNPFREKQEAVQHPVGPSLAPMSGYRPLPKGELFR